jgi:hypothetical protein
MVVDKCGSGRPNTVVTDVSIQKANELLIRDKISVIGIVRQFEVYRWKAFSTLCH